MEKYHYHDVKALVYWCSPECFNLTRSQINANLEFESDEFRTWILGNPTIGDKFHGEGNDIPLVQRIPLN